MTMSEKITDLAAATESDPRWASVVARVRRGGRHLLLLGPDHRRVLPPVVRGAAGAAGERPVPRRPREDAERAGFRPCKRCKPDQPSLVEQHAAKVTEACRLIETSPSVADASRSWPRTRG